MNEKQCGHCGDRSFLSLVTYKRYWHVCRHCGTAYAEQRSRYPLALLPFDGYRHQRDLDEQKMYDYFVEQSHIDWCVDEGQQFLRDYLMPSGLDVNGKSVLDISGGNGHAVMQLAKAGAKVDLTEINRKTIDYARKVHGLDVFEYNLNVHDLHDVTGKQYDIILARACIMFARDLRNFVDQVMRCLTPGGSVVIHWSVKPTIGVMTRVQLDEFSYYVLRQPETIVDTFKAEGFALGHRIDETDQTMYVYDNDVLPQWMLTHYWYEIRAARALARERVFELPARDRRRSTMVFTLGG